MVIPVVIPVADSISFQFFVVTKLAIS